MPLQGSRRKTKILKKIVWQFLNTKWNIDFKKMNSFIVSLNLKRGYDYYQVQLLVHSTSRINKLMNSSFLEIEKP